MIYEHVFEGLPVRTGDILCTRDGSPHGVFGRIWQAIGKLVPGEIDHCALYVGPGGRFVEADARGASVLTMQGERWDSESLEHRRLFVDTFAGVAYPLEGRDLSIRTQHRIREAVASDCLAQAAAHKPFNFNLFNASNPRRTYCSQMIAEAYRREGIELDRLHKSRLFRRAILPETLWQTCAHRRVNQVLEPAELPHKGTQDRAMRVR